MFCDSSNGFLFFTILQGAIAIEEENAKIEAENKRLAHIKHMENLILKQPVMWKDAAQLMLKSNARAYDEVVKILRELKKVAIYEDKVHQFEQQLGEFISPFLRRGSFMRRLQASSVL